jgi:SAM-dependent methyltransferase
MSVNINYRSREISEFYSCNRQTWEQFYPSERRAFKKIAGRSKRVGDLLDVGCACGGLATALMEKFTLTSYAGVDINKGAIEWAIRERKLGIPATFINGDIVKLSINRDYDTVVSLSCADWNIETNSIINTCWSKVKPGGYFVISLRLTPNKGVNDINKSYQFINFSGTDKKPEIANYVVFNFKDFLHIAKGLNPAPGLIGAYGYWGKPSATAVTPYDRLIFTVFYIKKHLEHKEEEIKLECNLPLEVFL